jgi:hypothetical protein
MSTVRDIRRGLKMSTNPSIEPRPATAADAEIAMRLYDMRRETEMRKARSFVSFEFWPANIEDYAAVAASITDPNNAYLRQVTSYWEMAASFVLRGVLHPGVFLDWCGEAFFVYAKFKPLVKEIRATLTPTAFANVEALATRYPEMADRVKMLEERICKRFPQAIRR